jgi:signal transduction histidine kinase
MAQIAMSARTSLPGSQSGVDLDASSVFGLLVEEQRHALSGAKSVLKRMRENRGVRDLDGLDRLERLFSMVRASSSYLGLSALREVVVEAGRVVDRLRWPGTRPSAEAVLALSETISFVATALSDARHPERATQHDERAAHVRDLLTACDLSKGSLLPDQLSDQELFAEDAKGHIALCRDALVRAADEGEERSEAVHAAFRAMHTLKGNAAMMGLGEIEALGRAAESALEGLRSDELTLTASLTVALLNLLEKADIALSRPHAFQWKREGEALEVATAESRLVAHRTRIGALLVERNYVSREQVELVLAIKREPLGQALILIHALSDQHLHEALDLQRKLRAGEEPPSVQPVAPRSRHLQVEQEKFERLSRRMARLAHALSDAPPELKEQARALEDAVLALDRSPLRGAFRRTAAMIRELADKQHKRLQVSLHGEELELTRHALSAVSDALVHLGRNAVDHGIEHEIERVTSLKPEVARISLVARREPHAIVIDVIDDGRGLHRERILRKALELNLVPLSSVHELRDDEVFGLVFSPGFSTAEGPTDVSGRGVGMDAVKHAIEAIGGSVEIASSSGKGARFRLRVPAPKKRTELTSLSPSELCIPDEAEARGSAREPDAEAREPDAEVRGSVREAERK